MRAPWQREDEGDESESELTDRHSEGQPLTPVVGGAGGFVPLHKEPSRYVRVRSYNTKKREFNRLFLAQELLGSGRTSEEATNGNHPASPEAAKLTKEKGAIWATEFSVDGQYLAVAGEDKIVRIFSVISTPEERIEQEEETNALHGGIGEKLNAPIFKSKPIREFTGHTGEVLALSWSKNNFLISSSLDKTVRLWHLSRPECLCTFKHSDLVTSAAFHPTDDRFFLAGSMDGQLRLWSIPDKDVAFTASTNELITAVAFSPDGKTSICGLLNGLCMFFDTEGLEPVYNIHARSSRGKNAKGSKITGIRTAVDPNDEEVKVLISSNDSRVRVYNMRTKMLEVKFKGLENQSSQIHATFSDDAKYIISGSEDRKAYIWNMHAVDLDNRDKQPYECFDAHAEVVTTALLAPTKTRQLVSNSCDPVYELCNPAPVTLRSLDETASLSTGSDNQSVGGTRKVEESPAYLERKKHKGGNILVTTDRKGTIKVFRQDCAYLKRQASWETGSRLSGRFASIGRSASVLTRTSGGSRANSRRTSLNMGHPSQHSSDMIMNWRQDVPGGNRSARSGSLRTERSMSPMKANRTPQNTSAANLAMEARKQPYLSSPSPKMENDSDPTSPTGSIRRPSAKASKEQVNPPLSPPTPSFNLVSASDSDSNTPDENETSFWNFSKWRPLSGLRYSISSSHLTPESAAQGTAPQTTEEQEPKTPPASKRHSLGAHEINSNKLRVVTDRGARRSIGPGVPMWSHREGSPAQSKDTRLPIVPERKKVDSGIAGLIEDEGGENGEEAVCEKCGGKSFRIKTATNGSLIKTCVKCKTRM